MKGLAALSLEGRRALVTGAGTGLGRAIAVGFAEAGADLVICGRRPDPLAETAALIEAQGATVDVVVADVTSADDVEKLRVAAGAIDILVNNAGRGAKAPWQTVPIDDWRPVVELNLIAPFRLCQVFAPGMCDRGFGRIVNIASVYGSMGARPKLYAEGWGQSAYFASKHGVHGVTHFLAPFLAPHGVSINSLSPGAILTSDQAKVAPQSGLDLLDRLAASEIQTGTVGAEGDYVAAAVLLASPGARYITGQNLVVDGGWSAW